MTDHAGELLGTFDVVFDDGSKRVVSVYRDEQRVRFQWPDHGGIPNEHMVRVANEGDMEGWVRELGYAFQKQIKTYSFNPARR